MDDITIEVSEFVNNISVTAQPNDQTIDITVTETVETVLLDVSTTVDEVTVTATQNVIVENITVDYVNNENNIDINVTDATQDVTLNITPTLVEINILRSGGEVNILQFNSLADFPATGSSDYFYLAKDTNKLYRWTGSAYAEISATANAVWGQIIGTLSEQTDLQNALNLKAPINSPTFTGTVSGITKTMVGLGAVDNTSDLDKPISTATQTALNNKQPLDGDLTSIAALSGTFGLLKKTANNSYTIDTNTYLTGITSSDVTTALGFTPENAANKGVNNGYASLDGGGKVPSSQLPSYVDDVIEVSSYSTLPTTGETGKIYITLDTNKIYRWTGSVYVEVSSSAAVWGGITGTLSNQTDLQSALDAKQDDLNGTGFVKASGTTISYDNTTYYPASNPNGYTTNTGTVTSVALTVPSAFSVSGSPITSSGTLAITAAGDTTQYIAGDGSLVTFPTIGTAGTLTREVRNTTGATLTKGTVVYISGATGNKPTVSKALATGDSTSAQTFGLVQANIANNANGNVVCVGDLTGLDTSAFTEGAQLYLSSTTAGTYTTTKQLAPNHLVYIGVVTRAHPTQGQIEVNIQNGYELYELHDVSITSEANNQGLFYEASTDLWKNKSIATVLGYTPANDANVVHTTGSESISGVKAFTTAIHSNILKFSESGGFNQTAGFTQIGGTADYFNFVNGGNTKSAQFTYNGAGGVYTLPATSGTLALTSDLHNAVTIGTANGLSLSTQVLSLALASTSATGALSSTDWNTFNNKASTASLANYLPLSGGTISTSSSSDALRVVNGGTGYALYVQSNSFFQGDAGFQSVGANAMVKTNSSSNLVAAVAGTDYVVPSALSAYLPLSGGTLTGALGGTKFAFSSSSNSDWAGAIDNLGTTGANGLYVNIGASSTGTPFAVYKNFSQLFKVANDGAATFSSSVTASGVRSINGGVDGTFQDAFVGVYSSNNNEQNAIQTAVSSGASLSGFRFQASNGGGSSSRTNIVDFVRDRAIFYTNVGIGTTSPSEKLHIAGPANNVFLNEATSGNYAINRIKNSTYTVDVGVDSSGLYLDGSTGSTRFYSGATERMRITSGGALLVGTTSDNGEKLQVTGITRTTEAYRQDTGSVSMASNTATTIYSLGGIRGLYILYASLPAGDASPSNYSSYAVIAWDTGRGRILHQTDGSNLFITLSGDNNVQARQTSGNTNSVAYRLIKIG
jgi:hypothetical protein